MINFNKVVYTVQELKELHAKFVKEYNAVSYNKSIYPLKFNEVFTTGNVKICSISEVEECQVSACYKQTIVVLYKNHNYTIRYGVAMYDNLSVFSINKNMSEHDLKESSSDNDIPF